VQPEWLVLVVFLAAMIADHLVLWPSFQRRVSLDAARARRVLWSQWALVLWGCTTLVMGLWCVQGRPLSTLGLAVPAGWRLWGSLALTAALVSVQGASAARLARFAGDRSKLRRQLGNTGVVLPHAASELPGWIGMSVTAGFCEEVLFRGFVVWMLQPFAGWWGAAAASLALFSLAHAYQGAEGLVRSAALGAAITVLVFVTGSLWPAILLHAAIDFMGGWIGWLILRDIVRVSPATEGG
jgi:hypothetical protein